MGSGNQVQNENTHKHVAKKKFDFRPHYFRAVLFVGIFVLTFYFVRKSGFSSRDGQPPSGLRFYPQFTRYVQGDVLLLGALVYVAVVLVGSRIMKNYQSFEHSVRRLQQAYNLFQIIVCLYMVYGLAPRFGFFYGQQPFALNSQYSKEIEYYVFIHYLTKYLDWCDTFFMLSKKKFVQISYLHVFHHATITVVWGFLLNEGVASGTAAFGAFMNSLTHVFMYTHYLVTSFGIKNPFKKNVTQWQLLQFAMCLVHSVFAIYAERVIPMEYALLQTMYQTFMLMLFGLYMNWVPAWLTGVEAQEKTKSL